MGWVSAEEFGELVSRRRRGYLAAAARGSLRVAETVYAAAVRWRNRRYDRGRATVHRVDAAVLSVGNLTLGGTGKTPMVEYLARWFGRRGVHVALVSRGYGAAADGPNDEARELAQKLPGVPHEQRADRVAAAQAAIARYASELLILDDGFQHRRLARDLDLVMLDATEPFGHGHVFPRGLLREPVTGLARAHVVALSRGDLVDAARREEIRRSVACFAPAAAWVETAHAPRCLLSASGRERPCDWLRDRSVAAFCGLGNPTAFRRLLEKLGAKLVGFRPLPDHHRYTTGDAAQLAAWARGFGAESLVCTHKDLVKLSADKWDGLPLVALVVGLEIGAGAEALEVKLQQLLARIQAPSTAGRATLPARPQRRSA